MLRTILYAIVDFIYHVHEKILSINNSREFFLNDKQLHFLVIGLLGMLFVLVVHPVFKAFAKRGNILAITWIYVFTLIIVITFAVEIGQRVTGTGTMDFADIVFGVAGFIFLFAIYAIIRAIVKAVKARTVSPEGRHSK